MSYKLVFDFTCRIEGQEDRIRKRQILRLPLNLTPLL